MGLLEALRAGIAAADGVLKPLQASVRFYRCTAIDKAGKKTYASAVLLLAHIDLAQKKVETSGGELLSTTATITFLDVAAVASATAGLGIREVDKIVLPSGATGPIIDIGGYVDPGTGYPVATEVTLG